MTSSIKRLLIPQESSFYQSTYLLATSDSKHSLEWGDPYHSPSSNPTDCEEVLPASKLCSTHFSSRSQRCILPYSLAPFRPLSWDQCLTSCSRSHHKTHCPCLFSSQRYYLDYSEGYPLVVQPQNCTLARSRQCWFGSQVYRQPWRHAPWDQHHLSSLSRSFSQL